MRSLVSISLSILLLLQTVNFGAVEILRVGDLVEHAQLHSEVLGDSFFSFINKHYGSLKNDHLSSHEGHEKLPFNHDSRTKTTISLFVFYPRQFVEIPVPAPISISVDFFYTDNYSSLIDQEIYQPPKMA